MQVKLIWNECRPGEEWQAGGLGSHFSIIKNDSGTYSIRRAIGDAPSRFAGMAETLEYAKTLCEHVVNKPR